MKEFCYFIGIITLLFNNFCGLYFTYKYKNDFYELKEITTEYIKLSEKMNQYINKDSVDVITLSEYINSKKEIKNLLTKCR